MDAKEVTTYDSTDEQSADDEFHDNSNNIEVQTTSQEVEVAAAPEVNVHDEHEDVPSEPKIATLSRKDSIDSSISEVNLDRRVALHDCLECECCTNDGVCCTVYQKGSLLQSPLREGRTAGWLVFDAIVFPLVPAYVRIVWVVLELLSSTLGFALSLASLLGQDQIEIFNYLHLALSLAFVLLSVLDTCASISIGCMNCKCRRQDVYNINAAKSGRTRWKSCCSCSTKSIDIVRIILTEALLYPLILCSVFEVVTGRGSEGNTVTDRVSFALLINSCLSFVLYALVARIALVGIIIAKVQKARMRSGYSVNKKETYSISALFYQLSFLAHVLFQTVAQILALIAVSVCIYIENLHFYEDNNTGSGSGQSEVEDVHVSWLLWTVMGISYVVPVMGFLSFFMVTNYWTQEFPIALYLDMLSLQKTKGVDDNISRIIAAGSSNNIIKGHFDNLHSNKNWCFKFSYPFRTPVIVIVCILYALLQMAFSTFVLAIPVVTEEGALINNLILYEWFIFFCVAIGIGAVANAYAFSVAAFWPVIVPVLAAASLPIVIAALALLVAVCLLIAIFMGILWAICNCLTCGHADECFRGYGGGNHDTVPAPSRPRPPKDPVPQRATPAAASPKTSSYI